MGINRIWQSTLAFRRFRKKTDDLSRIYWTMQMSTDCLNSQLLTKNPNSISTEEISCSFDSKMHNQTVSETLIWLPIFMERNRLHLLVIYTAFLETYLKEITLIYMFNMGYINNLNDISQVMKMTKVGEAIASPILKSSTVPEMLKYASELFDINFGTRGSEWIKIYKIRCAAAHNGGIATPKFLREVSGTPLTLAPQEYDNIGLTWDELRLAMRYADEIAALIDAKITNYNIRILETEQVLRELYSKNILPDEKKIWQVMHDKYGLFPIKKDEKKLFMKKFYNKMIY